MDKTDKQRRTFKISLVMDAVIMVIFLFINNTSNPRNGNLGLTTIYFAFSALLIILANILLYYYGKKA